MTLVPVRSHRRNFSAARPEKEQGTDADSKGNLQEKRAKSKSTSSRHQSSQLGQNFSQVAFNTRKLKCTQNISTKQFHRLKSIQCVNSSAHRSCFHKLTSDVSSD